MTAAGGDPGEKPQNQGQQPPLGGYEVPPIEHSPAYGSETYPAPNYGEYPPPGAFPPPAPPLPPGPPGQNFPPAPGYPPAGYPPPEYGAPYPGGYYYQPGYPPPPPDRTNRLAIGSIIASVFGLLCGIGSIVGIVLGALALNQIKRSREGGYGLAIAGIVIGVASLVISIVWMTYAWN